MKLTNVGKRAYIVKAKSVIKGGERIEKTEDVAINPGQTVEVTEECGAVLKTYAEIKILSQETNKAISNKKAKGRKNGVGASRNK